MPTIINQDTIWKSDGTLILRDDYQIAPGATLTIESGAKIEGNGHHIQVFGTLLSPKSVNSNSSFNDVKFIFGNNVSNPGHIDISGANFNGGHFLPATGNGGYGSFSVTDSIFHSVDGFYIWYPTSDSNFTRNIFVKSEGLSIGVSSNVRMNIEDNSFYQVEPPAGGMASVMVWANYGSIDNISVARNNFWDANEYHLELAEGYSSSKLHSLSNYFSGVSIIDSEKAVLDNQDSLNRAANIDLIDQKSEPNAIAPKFTASFSTTIGDIKSVGMTPDGQFLIIKSNGICSTFSPDALLNFNDTFSIASDLTKIINPIPVFTTFVDGSAQFSLPDLFSGPPSLNLKYQLIDSRLNAVVTGSSENDFIKLASTNSVGKAVDGGGGDDVIDGGVGSTFISGGGGSNTFFLDGRASGKSWSTITDFSIGVDNATIWGWKQGVSKIVLIDEFGGADGYKGLTLHFDNLLPSDASINDRNSNWNSITFSGKSLSDFGITTLDELNAQIVNGGGIHFQVGSVTDQYGDHGYLFLN